MENKKNLSRLTSEQKKEYLQTLFSKGRATAADWLKEINGLVVVYGGEMSQDKAVRLGQFFKDLPPQNERDYLTPDEIKKLKEIFDYETHAPFGGRLIMTVPASTQK